MSERFLELTRRADGTFWATFDDDRPPVPVLAWADVRRLRDKHHLDDHWAEGTREAFIAGHGHPFDDWWDGLSPGAREALAADPSGPVPAAYAIEITRSLRHEPGRDGLRVEGSFFSPAVREYVARRAAG